MNYSIRKMQISDYDQAILLWKSLPGIGLSKADEKSEIISFLKKNPHSCFVAEQNNKLIGTILGGSDGRRGYIYHLAVNPFEQKKGIGQKLVERCLNAFKVLGIQKCHIFVIADNKEGIVFWEKVNWQKRKDILVMSMELLQTYS